MYILFGFLLLHWIADFVLQSHWMATNKSKDWNALMLHTGIYSFVMSIPVFFLANIYAATIFYLITFFTHTAIDAITSRCTGYYAAKKDWHNMFVVVGFDQWLHVVQIVLTLTLLRL